MYYNGDTFEELAVHDDYCLVEFIPGIRESDRPLLKKAAVDILDGICHQNVLTAKTSDTSTCHLTLSGDMFMLPQGPRRQHPALSTFKYGDDVAPYSGIGRHLLYSDLSEHRAAIEDLCTVQRLAKRSLSEEECWEIIAKITSPEQVVVMKFEQFQKRSQRLEYRARKRAKKQRLGLLAESLPSE
jgi:hypothetical protein